MKPAAQVETEAAAWLAKRDSDDWGPSDQSALDAWLAASTANRIALLRLETVWTKADRLRAIGGRPEIEPDIPEPEPELMEAPGLRVRARWYMPLAAAAAALLALAIPSWFLLNNTAADSPTVAVYTTPVGGFQRLPLADGSRVELNTNTELDVAFTESERRIGLDRGEAFFNVAHDRQRPFVVEAGNYRVTAIGTAFSVRLTGDEISVAVTEGRVRVDRLRSGQPTEQPTFVSAGQRIDGLQSAAMVRPVAAQELEQSLSWRDGLLVFENRPLGEVAAEFNRYNSRQLVVDPSAAAVSVSGTFRANNLDGFLRLLGQGFGVDPVVRSQDEVLLRRG